MDNNLHEMCKHNNVSINAYSESKETEWGMCTVSGLAFSRCNDCGIEFYSHDQLLHNEEVTRKAIFEIKGGMTPGRIRLLREKYDLSQAAAAALFGGGARAFSKYENGVVTPSEAMERLLWLAEQMPAAVACLASREKVKVVCVGGLVDVRNVIEVDSGINRMTRISTKREPYKYIFNTFGDTYSTGVTINSNKSPIGSNFIQPTHSWTK